MNQQVRLGIDIGRVITDGDTDSDPLKRYNDERALLAPQMPGAFETIARLVKVFEGRVWIVSKCGANMERKSIAWLAHHGFHEATGIAADRLRFCRERRDKAPICKELGVTHFVDDRQDVLGYMVDVVPHRFLFNRNWPETEAAIMRTLSDSRP